MPMTNEEIRKLTQGIGLAAVAVGSLMIGKKYYEGWQLRNWAVNKTKEINRQYDNCFTIDRLIDADCVDGKTLTIGVNGREATDNILSKQGIRLGQDGDIKHLVSFVKADNGMSYEFENSTYLTLTQDPESKNVLYSYRTPDIMITKKMDDKIINMYKTIGLSSSELDTIAELKASAIKANELK
jgi:hypothetical protein